MIGMSVFLLLVLLLMSILLSAMAAGYQTLSTSHLRHWARQKDEAAKKLYPLKASGYSVLLTIELLRALCLSAVVVLITSKLSIWLAWLVIALLLYIAFIVLTQLYLKPLGIRLLMWLSPPLLSLTHALKPFMRPIGHVFDRFMEGEPVTLTRDELSKKLAAVEPGDTDLTEEELRILKKVLTFSRQTVHDAMIPKSKVTTVPEAEALTPVVVDSLYKSGHNHFPVMAEDKKTVVGILNMHDLMDIKQLSAIAGSMLQKVSFVDEDRDLEHVLGVFYKIKQTVFVVHNSASDMVGMITIEDVMQQILGKPSSKEHHETHAKASDEHAAMVE